MEDSISDMMRKIDEADQFLNLKRITQVVYFADLFDFPRRKVVKWRGKKMLVRSGPKPHPTIDISGMFDDTEENRAAWAETGRQLKDAFARYEKMWGPA